MLARPLYKDTYGTQMCATLDVHNIHYIHHYVTTEMTQTPMRQSKSFSGECRGSSLPRFPFLSWLSVIKQSYL